MKSRRFKIPIIFALAVSLAFCVNHVSAFPFFEEKPPEEARVPVIMYHLVTNSGKYQGKFGISPQEMENDLKYLKENGYETVNVNDLIRFVERREELPEKPVMLTFDDGSGSDYYYVLPLLEKYDSKAVMSIIGKVVEDYSNDGKNNKKPHVVWDQVKEMHKSKRVEIQNHSYDLHGSGGSGKKSGESKEAYNERLRKDLEKAQALIEDNIGSAPEAYAYPLGVISEGSEQVLRDIGFKASFSCAEGINIIRQDDEDCLFRLKRNVRRSGLPVGDILKKLEGLEK